MHCTLIAFMDDRLQRIADVSTVDVSSHDGISTGISSVQLARVTSRGEESLRALREREVHETIPDTYDALTEDC